MKTRTLTAATAAMLLTLCMAGCAQNTNQPASTTTAAPAASTTTTTEATTTPEETTAAEAPVLPDQKLFKGYVESGDVEYLMSAPDENSDKLEELTYGTMLEIYPCDTEGWYMAELGGETIGYVKQSVIKESPHTLPFGDRLFGGYIKTDEPANLYSEADESSEVIRQIPGGTQLDIYDSSVVGWYMTSVANDSDNYDIGYIQAGIIEKIPSYDMDGYEPNVSELGGRWIYEVQTEGSPETFVGIPVGYYIISENGTYRYTTDNISFTSGTISLTYEEFENGSKIPWYVFYDENGEAFMSVQAVAPSERTDGSLYIGQDGMQRIVPDYGNAIGGTDNASAPNEYGFYEFKNPPASGVSIAALSGTWKNAANDNDTLVITNGSDIYNGNFEASDGTDTVKGYVKLEYALNPDNSQSFWYTFYTTDGKFWNGFSVSGDIPLTDLYSGQDGAIHYVLEQ